MNSAEVTFWNELRELERQSFEPGLASRLARAWAARAQAEHASIASFSRFSLQLLAVGAPPELLESAHRAALDEIRHAQICFALASVFAREPLGPGLLPMPAEALGATSLAEAAAATYTEGCVGETLSALEAERAAEHATVPAIRTALGLIAAEEAGHSELAWAFVRWAVVSGGTSVLHAVEAAVAPALEQARRRDPSGTTDAELEAYGHLTAIHRHELRLQAIAEVLEPATLQLLRQPPGSA